MPLVLELVCSNLIHERRRLPIKNNIISFFGLHENDIQSCIETFKDNTLHIYITLTSRGIRCPECGKYIKTIKDYRYSTINNAIFIKRKCIIHYNRRRYVCKQCKCTINEINPFIDEYKNISTETVDNVLKLLKDYNHTFASVARETNLSKTKVIQIFDEHVQPERKPLSISICIDEFYFSRKANKKYCLLIIDFTRGNIIDILKSREKSVFKYYLRCIPIEERNKVKYVSIDMNTNYKEVAAHYFTNAVICADSFHVMKHINTALDSIRKRIMRRYEHNKKSHEYYLLKYKSDLLFMDSSTDEFITKKYNKHYKYLLSNQQLLDYMLSIDSDLYTAYYLRERYSLFNQQEYSEDTLPEFLDPLINLFLDSCVEEMVEVGHTLSTWRNEILNSFLTLEKKVTDKTGKRTKTIARVSNGPIEGRNKYIKLLLKLANGYSNFERFRNRAMYVLNKFEKPSNEKLPNKVKRHKT